MNTQKLTDTAKTLIAGHKGLLAMDVRLKTRMPWALAFSFSRAIQQPALDLWQGKEANVSAAQKALSHRAACNRAARQGKYSSAMEKTGM
jgi:fructose-bisphosphate aldolase class I